MLLRLEGAATFIAITILYFFTGGNWVLFIALLLVFDVFMLGYLKDPRIGSILYNLGHSYVIPFALAGIFFLLSNPLGYQICFIWIAHIGSDRLFGYGLKYEADFKDTHLQHV